MATDTINILFLNSIDASTWGGLEHWMELTGTGLTNRGFGVYVAGRPNSEFLRRVSSHENVTILPLDISGDFNPGTIREITRIVKKHSIRAILCNFVKDVRLAGMAREFAPGYKIIWTPGVNLAKRSLSHKYMFSGFVDHVIVPSKHLRDDIVASGYIPVEKFSVIPIGIDAGVWSGSQEEGRAFLCREFNLPKGAFICLTSGRFVPQKGHTHLVDAAERLVREYDNIFFVFLGDGPLQMTIMEKIHSLDLTDRFIFCGLLTCHQPAVGGADIYVHPAIIEPYGIVLVEAMAAGLPIVTTRVGGIPEVVAENENAILVDAADAGGLADAIKRFYLDGDLKEAYGRAGRKRFEAEFLVEKMIERIEKTVREVVAL